MVETLQKIQHNGQQATLYISSLAAEIAQARHFRFYSGKQTGLLVDHGPHVMLAHGIDRWRANRQQKQLRRLQAQAVVIGTCNLAEPMSNRAAQQQQFDIACSRYYRTVADHGIIAERMANRFAPR